MQDNEDNNNLSTSFDQDVGNKKFNQYLAAITSNLSAFSMGICISWTSFALPLLQRGDSKIPITLEEGSWIGSLLPLGALFGVIKAGTLAEKCGPKRLLQYLAFPLFGSWVIIAFCWTVYGVYLARFLAGISIGAICVAAPAYVAELAEVKISKTLGTLFQLQITLGQLCGYIMGGCIDDFILSSLIPAIVPLIFLVSLSFVPESPVYLCAIGDVYEARESLQWFRGKRCDVNEEISKICTNVNASNKKVYLKELVTSKSSKKAIILSICLIAFQQLSGISAFLFYTSRIFAIGGSLTYANNCAILIGLVQVVATYLSTLLIDHSGRRFLLLTSSSIMALSLIFLGLYFYFQFLPEFSFIPMASISLYIIAYSIGFGPIPWTILGELFEDRFKGMATSITYAVYWILAFIVTKFFGNLAHGFGPGLTLIFFGVVCAVGTVFIYLVIPETRGRNIEEIRDMLGGSSDTRKDEAETVVILNEN